MGHAKKIAVCLLAGVVTVIVFQRIICRAIWEFGKRSVHTPTYAIIALVLLVLALVGVLIFSRRVAAAWEGILGFMIALDLSMFGWQKLFHQQGNMPLARLDEPFSNFSGEDLTWAFFGH